MVGGSFNELKVFILSRHNTDNDNQIQLEVRYGLGGV